MEDAMRAIVVEVERTEDHLVETVTVKMSLKEFSLIKAALRDVVVLMVPHSEECAALFKTLTNAGKKAGLR